MPWNPSTSYRYQTKVPRKLRQKNLQRMAPEPGQKESVMYSLRKLKLLSDITALNVYCILVSGGR